MAVLVEAISVIVRRDSIESKYAGGWEAFLTDVPNATLCSDDQLARVGFMDPNAVGKYVGHLESKGLLFQSEERSVDIAVVDQQRGLTLGCDWLEFAPQLSVTEGVKMSACWFFEGPRMGHGLHIPGGPGLKIATPAGWEYEGSLSQRFSFVETGRKDERLKFLRAEGGVKVYLDLDTGKEVYSTGDE